MRLLLCLIIAAAGLLAQSLRIYSEFQRIDPFGEVVPPDRNTNPREILSPMVARNAHASFQLAVRLPSGTPAFLHVQQNPEQLRITVYKEIFDHGIPDALEQVSLPSLLLLPEQAAIKGQRVLLFWLDLWVPADTPVRRMRCDALLNVGSQWIVAPMEVRIMGATAGKPRPLTDEFPPVTARADAFACSTGTGRAPAFSIRRFIRRDALQDESLLGHSLCIATEHPKDLGPEWYLRARDALLR